MRLFSHGHIALSSRYDSTLESTCVERVTVHNGDLTGPSGGRYRRETPRMFIFIF